MCRISLLEEFAPRMPGEILNVTVIQFIWYK